MKYAFLFFLALTACSKEAHQPSAPLESHSSEALHSFDDTTQESEEKLLALTSAALRAGIPLDAPHAERCWSKEEKRPVLREACALLWAGKGSDSAVMESALLEGRSRALTIALLHRRHLLGQIPFLELIARLDALSEDPLWIRADLARAWLESHSRLGIAESEPLLKRIQPSENSGPRDLAASLSAIHLLRPGVWRESLSGFCDAAAMGESRLRCWRLLASLDKEAEELRYYLPSPSDDDWILFSRSFPALAVKLRPYLR